MKCCCWRRTLGRYSNRCSPSQHHLLFHSRFVRPVTALMHCWPMRGQRSTLASLATTCPRRGANVLKPNRSILLEQTLIRTNASGCGLLCYVVLHRRSNKVKRSCSWWAGCELPCVRTIGSVDLFESHAVNISLLYRGSCNMYMAATRSTSEW